MSTLANKIFDLLRRNGPLYVNEIEDLVDCNRKSLRNALWQLTSKERVYRIRDLSPDRYFYRYAAYMGSPQEYVAIVDFCYARNISNKIRYPTMEELDKFIKENPEEFKKILNWKSKINC